MRLSLPCLLARGIFPMELHEHTYLFFVQGYNSSSPNGLWIGLSPCWCEFAEQSSGSTGGTQNLHVDHGLAVLYFYHLFHNHGANMGVGGKMML